MEPGLAQLWFQFGFAGLLIGVIYLLMLKLGGRALTLVSKAFERWAQTEDRRTAALEHGLANLAAGQQQQTDAISDLRADVARLQGFAESSENTGVHAIPQHIPTQQGRTPPGGSYSQHRPRTQGGR